MIKTMNFLIVAIAKYLYIICIIIAALWVYLKAREKLREILTLVLISFPLAYLSAKILGHFYYNSRPFVVENVKPLFYHAPSNGFPSDHTLLTMAVASVIFLYNKKLGVFLGILSLAVGYARVAAHVHHQIDIWGAAAIAIVAVYISAKTINRFGVKFAK